MDLNVKDALARWHDSEHEYPSDEHREDDAFELADAFADQHPLDDMEPITSKWLQSIGARMLSTPVGGVVMCVISTGTIQIALDTMPGALQIWISTQKGREIQTSATQVISSGCTRGDVRRLCAAVGHRLKG